MIFTYKITRNFEKLDIISPSIIFLILDFFIGLDLGFILLG